MALVAMEIERSAAARLPRWDPGVRGQVPEVPTRLEMTPQYVQAFPSFTAALNAAILEVETPGAVVIPARFQPYDITGTIHMRSGVVVRGEGPTKTKLRARLVREGAGIEGSGLHAVFAFQGERLGSVAVAQDVQPGDRTLVLGAAAPGVRPEVGQALLLTMENDPAHGWDRFVWEKRARGQVLEVTGVEGGRVTLDAGVRLPYPMSRQPEAELQRPIEGAGLEHLRIINDAGTQAHWTTTFWRAVNCWLRNCEIELVPDVACWVWNSRWITVEGCFVHGARDYAGGKGYGVDVCGHSSDCLVADNIFQQLRHSMMAQFGASGNVFAYNASLEPAMSDISLHGWYAYMNLFEGNTAAQIYVDNAWGRSGEHNTFFRNRLEGFEADYEARLGIDITDYADHTVEFIQVEPGSDSQNIMANTILDSRLVLRGCRDTWVEKNLLPDRPADGPTIDTDVAVVDTIDIDNHASQPTVDPSPPLVRPSLYLDAAPHFWVTTQKPWPAIGADVDRASAGHLETIPAQDRYAKVGSRHRFGPWKPDLSAAGASTAGVGEALEFRMNTVHQDGRARVRYLVDWGDGTVTATEFSMPRVVARASHTWTRAGQFEVRCQARDQYGFIGRWSAGVRITIA